MSDQLLRTIERVQSEIRQGENLNERQTINYLISPILNSLGWNVYDRTRVIHEFPVGNGQVDMAFKHDDKTVVFLEAKRVGVDLGVQELKQLGGYCFDLGVPTAILSNGVEWSVYRPLLTTMPMKDRRLIHVDLRQSNAAEIVRELSRLDFKLIDRLNRADLPLMLNNYWNCQAKEELLEPFARTLREKFAGHHNKRPTEIPFGPIKEMLKSRLFEPVSPPLPPMPPLPHMPPPSPKPPWPTPTSRIVAIELEGEHFRVTYVRDVLVHTAEWLVRSGRLQRHDCPIRLGRGQRYLVHTIANHPNGSPFAGPKHLSNGLFLEANFSARDVIRHSYALLEMFNFRPANNTLRIIEE